jgi:hypothetical protein
VVDFFCAEKVEVVGKTYDRSRISDFVFSETRAAFAAQTSQPADFAAAE